MQLASNWVGGAPRFWIKIFTSVVSISWFITQVESESCPGWPASSCGVTIGVPELTSPSR